MIFTRPGRAGPERPTNQAGAHWRDGHPGVKHAAGGGTAPGVGVAKRHTACPRGCRSSRGAGEAAGAGGQSQLLIAAHQNHRAGESHQRVLAGLAEKPKGSMVESGKAKQPEKAAQAELGLLAQELEPGRAGPSADQQVIAPIGASFPAANRAAKPEGMMPRPQSPGQQHPEPAIAGTVRPAPGFRLSRNGLRSCGAHTFGRGELGLTAS
jgi:hypothetical protein